MDDNKLCYICSPYRGDTERNIAYAIELTRIALENGYLPITPHLYFTQALDDNVPEQRELGLKAGIAILSHCKYILIGGKYGVSEGMRNEINIAVQKHLTELSISANGLEVVYEGKT